MQRGKKVTSAPRSQTDKNVTKQTVVFLYQTSGISTALALHPWLHLYVTTNVLYRTALNSGVYCILVYCVSLVLIYANLCLIVR